MRNMKPSPQLRNLLLPRIEPSSLIMAIQVTLLKCGGVALGAAIHHAAVEVPCHDRTLLRARSPPTVQPGALSKFCSNLTQLDPSAPVVSAVLDISPDKVASLKRLCGGESAFCAMSALLWQCQCIRLVAASRPSSSSPPDQGQGQGQARFIFPANVRRKIRPPLPAQYFGNAVIRVCAAGAAGDIASEALASVAGRIRGAITGMDDELVRSAIDYSFQRQQQLHGEAAAPADYGTLPETDLHVTSWLGMPLYDADFGWGRPQLMSRAESMRAGFVFLTTCGDDDGGGVCVLIFMEAENTKEMERLLLAKLHSIRFHSILSEARHDPLARVN